MKYFKLTLIILLLSTFSLIADTHVADTCSLADVATAVGLASTDDTVTVPSGECNWASALTINKTINLIGAGAGTDKVAVH